MLVPKCSLSEIPSLGIGEFARFHVGDQDAIGVAAHAEGVKFGVDNLPRVDGSQNLGCQANRKIRRF